MKLFVTEQQQNAALRQARIEGMLAVANLAEQKTIVRDAVDCTIFAWKPRSADLLDPWLALGIDDIGCKDITAEFNEWAEEMRANRAKEMQRAKEMLGEEFTQATEESCN